MKKILTWTFGLALVLMGGLLAGCGGGGAAEAPADPNAPITLDFEATDIAFDTNSVTVAAGQSVRIRMNNAGTLEHNWLLISGDVDPLTATEDDALIAEANTGRIAGGDSVSVNFEAPSAPGTYTFVCTVEGHAAAGMLGDFVVQ